MASVQNQLDLFLVTGLIQIIVRLIISYFGMNYVSPLKKKKKIL